MAWYLEKARPKGIRGYGRASKSMVEYRAARRDHREHHRPMSNAERIKADQVTVGVAMYYALRSYLDETPAQRKKRQKKRDERRKSS